jgi:hypothetical protein
MGATVYMIIKWSDGTSVPTTHSLKSLIKWTTCTNISRLLGKSVVLPGPLAVSVISSRNCKEQKAAADISLWFPRQGSDVAVHCLRKKPRNGEPPNFRLKIPMASFGRLSTMNSQLTVLSLMLMFTMVPPLLFGMITGWPMGLSVSLTSPFSLLSLGLTLLCKMFSIWGLMCACALGSLMLLVPS